MIDLLNQLEILMTGLSAVSSTSRALIPSFASAKPLALTIMALVIMSNIPTAAAGGAAYKSCFTGCMNGCGNAAILCFPICAAACTVTLPF